MSIQPHHIAKLQSAMRDQRFERDRKDNLEARLHVEVVETIIGGPGEAEADLPFACRFLEKPHVCNPAYDLDPSGVTAVQRGSFPTLLGGAQYFLTIEVKPGVLHYIGAHMLFVATGPDGMVMNAHCRFEGKALVGPGVGNGGIL